MVSALDANEAQRRAARVRVVLTDVDGVLTDGGVYYGPEGEALLRFDRRDGMGVERLRAAGIETVIVTREVSPIVRRRAEKLRIACCFEGVLDKRLVAARCAELGFTMDEVAFIGDDVNDLGLLELVHDEGLTAAPCDAQPGVRAAVHYCCATAGGHGAFRELAEWILSLRAEAALVFKETNR